MTATTRWARAAVLAGLMAWAMSVQAAQSVLDDLPVNRWVPVKVKCENGDPRYHGGCPSGRGWIQLAYDSKRDAVVLFGGSGEWYFNDLWYYDLKQQLWTLILQDTRLAGVEKDWSEYPRGRDNHNFVYDTENDVYWLYGGTGKGGMWRFHPDRKQWEALWPTHGTGPLKMASMDPGFAYSADHDGMLLFGGTRYSPRDETWWFDAKQQRWQRLNPKVHPQARTQIENAMVYDTRRRQFILFGGQLPGKNRPSLNDTWIFHPEQRTWQQMNPDNPPPARDRHMMVFDQKNGVAIMLGANAVADTWIYFPDENRWQELVSARGDYDARESFVSGAVYIPKYDLTLYRDKRGNMYYLRLNLSKGLGRPVADRHGPSPSDSNQVRENR